MIPSLAVVTARGVIPLTRTRNALLGAFLTVAFVVGGAAAASAAPAPPDPGALAGSLANNAGGAYLDAVVEVLPLLIPFLAAMWAIGFVWTKLRPKRKGGI